VVKVEAAHRGTLVFNKVASDRDGARLRAKIARKFGVGS